MRESPKLARFDNRRCRDVRNYRKVEASVVSEGKGKKVIVYKYKRKTGYHKKNGHRQLFTQVKIDSIVG